MWQLKSHEIQIPGKNIKEAGFCATSLDERIFMKLQEDL